VPKGICSEKKRLVYKRAPRQKYGERERKFKVHGRPSRLGRGQERIKTKRQAGEKKKNFVGEQKKVLGQESCQIKVVVCERRGRSRLALASQEKKARSEDKICR